MALSIVTQFDEFYSMQKGKLTYPSVCIEEPSDELTVLVEGLPQGSLPLVVKHHGRLIQVSSISKTPEILARIMKLYQITLMCSPESMYRITSIDGLLDVEDFPWME